MEKMERKLISLLSLKKKKNNRRKLLIKICLALPNNNPVKRPPTRYRATLQTNKRSKKQKLIDNKWIDKCNSFSKQGRSFIQEEVDKYVNKVRY